MRFEVNGESQDAPEPLSLHQLLEQFDLAERRVAVAINSEVVPRSEFERAAIHEGDRVEVIQAVGGG